MKLILLITSIPFLVTVLLIGAWFLAVRRHLRTPNQKKVAEIEILAPIVERILEVAQAEAIHDSQPLFFATEESVREFPAPVKIDYRVTEMLREVITRPLEPTTVSADLAVFTGAHPCDGTRMFTNHFDNMGMFGPGKWLNGGL